VIDKHSSIENFAGLDGYSHHKQQSPWLGGA
jgi:hypothetical protein